MLTNILEFIHPGFLQLTLMLLIKCFCFPREKTCIA
jgi:hypothetical protein